MGIISLKDDTFALLKKNIKITKERIPAATQLFTPDWNVRYMVENSLGRLWLEGHPNTELHDGWKYYLDEAEQEPEVEVQLAKLREEYKTIKPEEIKVIDPCMGSGHILVYAFDVLMQIYTSAGWDQREAARSILKNNLYGLDIDDRAAQLAYFAVMMKAHQYNRKILSPEYPIELNLYVTTDSTAMTCEVLDYIANGNSKLRSDLESIAADLRYAKEYGSIINITPVDFQALFARFEEIRTEIHMQSTPALNTVLPLVKLAQVLAQKYDVVVTNPPYMGAAGMGVKLSDYVKENYPDSKADMFAVLIERCMQMTKENGYQAMITQHAWMFLSSFEKLRAKLLAVDIVNMAHLGARAFEEIGGEVVQTTSFVIRKSHITDYKGEYCRLIEPTSQQGKEDMFLSGENRYATNQADYKLIPGTPIAYWVTAKMVDVFPVSVSLSSLSNPRQGLITGDVNRFVRKWYECSVNTINFHAQKGDLDRKGTWFPYCNGGSYRKWYGNNDDVVNWREDGYEVRNFVDDKGKQRSRPQNQQFYFCEGATWSAISTSLYSIRYFSTGFLFSNAGMAIYADHEQLLSLIGFLNSKLCPLYLSVFNEGINYNQGDIAKLPIIRTICNEISHNVEDAIRISKTNWDSYETSWDFKRNPLV